MFCCRLQLYHPGLASTDAWSNKVLQAARPVCQSRLALRFLRSHGSSEDWHQSHGLSTCTADQQAVH